jgi:TrmH family RNA methyltransferase
MITSRSNSRVKEIRLLKQARHRQARAEYFIEGVRLVEEALQQSLAVSQIAYSPRLEKTDRGVKLLSLARKRIPDTEWLYLSDQVLGTLCDTQSHQGVLAVLKKKERSVEEIWQRDGMILLFYELQDPGNLGAIFRLADAGGAAGLIFSEGTIDPYSPKVVRASMGSFFRVPFLKDQDLAACLELLRSRGYRILATALRGQPSFWEVDFSRPVAVLFGQEGGGLSGGLMRAADGLFTIPMAPGVDSLNVAMAAALVIYEAMRQRQGPSVGAGTSCHRINGLEIGN